MLKTSSTESAKSSKGGVEINADSRAKHDGKCELDGRETSNDEINDKVDDEVDNEVGKKGQKMSMSKNFFKKLFKSKKMIGLGFLTFTTRLAFIKLR